MLRRTNVVIGDIAAIDLKTRRVRVTHRSLAREYDLAFDQLVVGIGAVTNFFHTPGMEDGLNFSDFIACWMWRGIYLSKLPGFPKKVRVTADWFLDSLYAKDIVQLRTLKSGNISDSEESSQHPSEPTPAAAKPGAPLSRVAPRGARPHLVCQQNFSTAMLAPGPQSNLRRDRRLTQRGKSS